MRITVHATIENAEGSSAPQVVEIGEVSPATPGTNCARWPVRLGKMRESQLLRTRHCPALNLTSSAR